MIHMYINDTPIPKMLELMLNGTTKAKLLEKSVLAKLCQDTLGECIIKLGFKYY